MMQEPPIPMRAEIISHDVDNHGRKRHHMSQPDIPEFSTGKDFTQERPTKRNRVEGSFPSSLLLGDVGMAAVSAAAAAAAGPSLLQYLSMPTTSTIRPNEPEAFDDGGNDGLDGTSNFQNGAPFFPFFGGQSIAAAANADADAAPRSYHSSVPQTFPNIPSQFACEPVEKNIDKSLDLNENHITFDPEDAIMSAPFCYPHWKEDQDPQHTATITGAGLNRNSPPPSIESTTPRADSYAYSPPSPYSSSEFSGPTEIDFTPGNPSTPATDMTVTATEDITNTSASEDTYAKYASDSADAGVISGLLPTAVDSSSLMLSGEHQFDTDIATPELNDGNAFGYEKGGTSELAFLANLEIPEYQTEQQQEQLNQPSSINAGLVGNFGGIGELDQFKISAADLEALGAIPWTHNQMMIWENQSRPAGPTIPGSDAHSNETDEGKPADGATVETYENNNDDEGFIPDAAIFDEHGSVRGCLPPTLPAGHRHKKFLVVEDTQNGRRMRIKCALENTDIGEIPDSYCKSNAVFPRSWRPRHGPVGDEEFGSEEAGTPTTTSTDDAGSKANSPEEPFTVLPLLHRPKGGRWYKVSDTLGDSASNVISPSLNSNDSNGGNCAYQQVPNGPYPKDDPAEKATNKGVISVFLSNGEWTEFNIPRPRKRRIECALNELGSRMSWAQSRTFSGRPLFLQRACKYFSPLDQALSLSVC